MTTSTQSALSGYTQSEPFCVHLSKVNKLPYNGTTLTLKIDVFWISFHVTAVTDLTDLTDLVQICVEHNKKKLFELNHSLENII